MTHGGAAPNGRRSRLGIHRDGVHPPQVDHEAALREGPARDTVPAAADRDLEAEVACEMHRAHDIMHVGALGDDAGPAIDHRVEDRPSLIVGGVVGDDDRPREIPTELVEGGLIGLHGHVHPPFGLPTGCK